MGSMTTRFILRVLKGIPTSFEESAKLDGANIWQIFIYVLAPALFPMAGEAIHALKDYESRKNP